MSNRKPDGRICLKSVKPCCASHAQSLMRGARVARLQKSITEAPDVKSHKNEDNNQENNTPSEQGLIQPRREKVILYSPEDLNKKLFIWLTCITVAIVSLFCIGASAIVIINGKSAEPLTDIAAIIFAFLASVVTFGTGYLLGKQSNPSMNEVNI